ITRIRHKEFSAIDSETIWEVESGCRTNTVVRSGRPGHSGDRRDVSERINLSNHVVVSIRQVIGSVTGGSETERLIESSIWGCAVDCTVRGWLAGNRSYRTSCDIERPNRRIPLVTDKQCASAPTRPGDPSRGRQASCTANSVRITGNAGHSHDG